MKPSPFDQEGIRKAREAAAEAGKEIAARAKELADQLNKGTASIKDEKLRKSTIYTGV